ncbi:MAG: hypothetical protein P8125_13585, partial [Gemmatimonadota bacterium]
RTGTREVVDEGFFIGHPAWSPDGGSLVYTRMVDRDDGYVLVRRDLDGMAEPVSRPAAHESCAGRVRVPGRPPAGAPLFGASSKRPRPSHGATPLAAQDSQRGLPPPRPSFWGWYARGAPLDGAPHTIPRCPRHAVRAAGPAH